MSGYPNQNNYPSENYPDGTNYNASGVPFVPNHGTSNSSGLTPAQASSLLHSGVFMNPLNPLAFTSTLTTTAPVPPANASSAAAFAAADAAAAFLCSQYAQQYEAAYNAAAAAAAAKDQQQQQSQLNPMGVLPFLNPALFSSTVPSAPDGTGGAFNPMQQYAGNPSAGATFPAMSTTTYSTPFPQMPVNQSNLNPTSSSPMRTVSSTLVPQSISPPSSICRDFQLGRCVRGDACRYSHGQGSSSAVNTSPPQQPRQMCGDFLKGRCTRGDACRYSHDKMSGPPCRDFLKGVCTRGDSCRYHHFDPSSSVNVDFDGDDDGDDDS